jgi:hypothetical protein
LDKKRYLSQETLPVSYVMGPHAGKGYDFISAFFVCDSMFICRGSWLTLSYCWPSASVIQRVE